MDYTFEKHFSLEEANSLIPGLRKAFADVQRLSGEAQDRRRQEVRAMAKGGNGHKPKKQKAEAAAALANQILAEIGALGIVVQDWRRGLVDFPHILDSGREVFLCYELDDGTEIQYYHDLDTGYAGRKPL
jgi:hypothetical protein